jgi:hypothetical protein
MFSLKKRIGVWFAAHWFVFFVTASTVACNGTTIAQDIVNWTPTIQSTAATVASVVSSLAPQDALIIGAALVGFDAGSNLVCSESKAYLANPGQTALQALQTGAVTFQQQISAALLAAVRITNPQSQATISLALNGGLVAMNAILALIQQIKGNTLPATVKAVAMNHPITMRQTANYRDSEASIQLVANHYWETRAAAKAQVERAEWNLETAGL